MEFGQRLKKARIRAGLTQEDIVREIGVSRQTVSNWENGRSYPDLSSVVKLSDLYGVPLEDLLREDAELRREEEARKERIRRWYSYAHDLGVLLAASNLLWSWAGRPEIGMVLGIIGMLLICAVHVVFVRKLDVNWKIAGLRCLSTEMVLIGLMLRINCGHTSIVGNVLWFGGLTLQIWCSAHLDWNRWFPKHMTAVTGFAIALILVFGAIPVMEDSVGRGDHIEGNPFTGTDYRVTEVLQGGSEELPMVYLGSGNNVYLDYPGEKEYQLDGTFINVNQPAGAAEKGIWELIPKAEPELRYRVTVESDDTLTISCREEETVNWEYQLEPAPKVGCSILDVLGSVRGPVDWYYADTFSEADLADAFPLRAKGRIKLSVPGDTDTVTIYEEFREGERAEYQVLTLERDERGFVEFSRETRDSEMKQTGIYRIPYEDGEFVLVLNYMK